MGGLGRTATALDQANRIIAAAFFPERIESHPRMSPEFEQLLIKGGARLAEGIVIDFGDPAGELQAAASGAIVTSLSGMACVQFSGDDAETFLHGQLSCDVKGLLVNGATYGSYCSPQGRMLANFLLLRIEQSFLMLLPSDIAEATQKRLSMFILRSKVKASRADFIVLGLSGAASLSKSHSPVMTSTLEADGSMSVRLDDSRGLLVVPSGAIATRWNALASECRPAGVPAWEWLDIRSGIPWIHPTTREEFIPQMANVDLIGGVSFSKGCYPGQEIVARTQFRGQVKRRMYLAHVDAPDAPRAGDALYSDELGDQASGKVVAAQAAPAGGYDLLAVVTVASKENSVVRLGSSLGPVLRFEPLPYSFPSVST